MILRFCGRLAGYLLGIVLCALLTALLTHPPAVSTNPFTPFASIAPGAPITALSTQDVFHADGYYPHFYAIIYPKTATFHAISIEGRGSTITNVYFITDELRLGDLIGLLGFPQRSSRSKQTLYYTWECGLVANSPHGSVLARFDPYTPLQSVAIPERSTCDLFRKDIL